MDAKQLAALVAVAEEGSLAAAGRALGLSHSAVSLRIKALETAFETELLDRSRKPPRLTVRGRALVERARRLLRLMAEIREFGGRSGLAGRLSLGVAPSALTHLAPPALSALRAAHPGLSLRLETGLTSDLAAAVKIGRLDAALGTLPEENPPPQFDALASGLDVRRVAREPLAVIAPLDAEETEPQALLSSRPFIWFSRRTWAGSAIERLIAERGFSVADAMEVDSIEAVEAMTRHGLGVSIIPARAAAPHPADLRRIPLGAPTTYRALGLFARREAALRPFVDEFFAALKTVAGQTG